MEKISDLETIIRKVNCKYSGYDRLYYCLPNGKMTIFTTVNVSGEPFLRMAKEFAEKYNLNFKREHDFARGGESPRMKPILYVNDVPRDKDSVGCVAMSLVNLKNQLYEEMYHKLQAD